MCVPCGRFHVGGVRGRHDYAVDHAMCEQDVGDADLGWDEPGGPRRGQCGLDERLQAMLPGVVGHASPGVDDHLDEGSGLDRELDQAGPEVAERVRSRFVGERFELREALLEHREGQLEPGGEVPVEDPLTDTRVLSDGAESHVVAAFGEEAPSRVEDRLTVRHGCCGSSVDSALLLGHRDTIATGQYCPVVPTSVEEALDVRIGQRTRCRVERDIRHARATCPPRQHFVDRPRARLAAARARESGRPWRCAGVTATGLDRLERRADEVRVRVRGRNPAVLILHVARRCSEVRVAGLAAEMCYYLVVSIVPLLTALGAGLGLVGIVVRPDKVARMEAALTSTVEAVLSPELASDIAVPLIQELLRSEQVGLALGSIGGALFLGSRAFRAAMRALGDAYRVKERRGVVKLWGLSLVFTAAAVVVLLLMLSLLVVGPLLGGGQRLADMVGGGELFRQGWSFGRWPVVLLVCVVFLAWLYRVARNSDMRWRDAVPGALFATIGLVVLFMGFRLYVDLAGPQGLDVEAASDAVGAVGAFIGTALAVMLLGWLASMIVLVGGVFNAEWNGCRPENQRPDEVQAQLS